MPTPIRRFLLWSLAAWVSAAPSFLIARIEFHEGAMALGVLLFTLFLTAISCTPQFERIHRRPFVRETLYVGYGMRMLISILFPVGLFFDFWLGAASVSIGERLFDDSRGFFGTLFITLVQGTLINLIVLAFMGIVYSFQMTCRTPAAPRRNLSVCANCRYDLRGSRKSERCPECGETVPWLASSSES